MLPRQSSPPATQSRIGIKAFYINDLSSTAAACAQSYPQKMWITSDGAINNAEYAPQALAGEVMRKYFSFLDLACIKVFALVLQRGLLFFTLPPC